jgi:hypothetical protein
MHENLHTVTIFHSSFKKLKLAAILDAILDSEAATSRSNSSVDSYTRDIMVHNIVCYTFYDQPLLK